MSDATAPRALDPAQRWKTLAVLALVGLLGVGIALDQTVFKVSGPRTKMAPDAVFYDRAGKRVALEDYRGKLVLLNFWATWCGPCVDEAPSLDSLAAHLQRDLPDVVVLAPGMDDQGFEAMDPFVKKLKLTNLTILHDKDRDAFDFGTRKLPETWLIGRDGEILERFVGALNWAHPDVFQMLQKAATEGPDAFREARAAKTAKGSGT